MATKLIVYCRECGTYAACPPGPEVCSMCGSSDTVAYEEVPGTKAAIFNDPGVCCWHAPREQCQFDPVEYPPCVHPEKACVSRRPSNMNAGPGICGECHRKKAHV